MSSPGPAAKLAAGDAGLPRAAGPRGKFREKGQILGYESGFKQVISGGAPGPKPSKI
eukprot:COSAG06_NODE_26585_length_612_cov_1.542969_1_plen_56_part_01